MPLRVTGFLKHVVRSVAQAAKTATSSQIRRGRATVVAAIVSVIVGVQGGFLRPTIATHLIVFALGVLYGTFIRNFESKRQARLEHHEKPFRRLPGRVATYMTDNPPANPD